MADELPCGQIGEEHHQKTCLGGSMSSNLDQMMREFKHHNEENCNVNLMSVKQKQ